ncbi:nitrilase-related carbon-nitrogen hydrolase [Marinifilum flexuosum]|uniref:N-carbamoylputrescine amidase n=1 Tax=Marinifilum flexuosum TaxID=1117708 RepID=A0A419WX80_9BACT|nr:nitrilase-related carbon-nitrogen hydrolase [Marinifilum flexuosum]RKE00050.1 N-carbamoylputrescine amidase [Marinifilum flexuosum]
MIVAVVSSKCRIGDVGFNLSTTMEWIKSFDEQGVNFILFPELNLSGYIRDIEILKTVLNEEEQVFTSLLEISKSTNLAFAVGFPEQEGERYFITHFVFEGGKVVGKHRKTHVSISEKEVYSEGDEINVFPVKDMRIGIQICYETHFPEISAIQAQKGANVLAMAFASPKETCQDKIERFKRYIPARAYDNACFAMICNQVTTNDRGTVFPCASLIIDPKGKVMSESFVEENEFAVAEIDISEINRIKESKMAFFNAHKRTEWLREYYE